MNAQTHVKITQMTIGDLIVAVTDAAVEATQDQNKAYEIAGLADEALTGPCAGSRRVFAYFL